MKKTINELKPGLVQIIVEHGSCRLVYLAQCGAVDVQRIAGVLEAAIAGALNYAVEIDRQAREEAASADDS